MPPTLTPQDFAAKWRLSTTKERSASKENIIDVHRMAGGPGRRRNPEAVAVANLERAREEDPKGL